MADKVWSGERLNDLLTLTPKQLHKKYPNYTLGYLKTHKQRVTKRILKRIARMEKDPNYQPTAEQLDEIERLQELLSEMQQAGMPVNPEDAPRVKSMKFWQTSAYDAQERDWTTTTNYGVTLGESVDDVDYFPPAEAARITPSRRKAKNKPYKDIFIFSDAQIDYRRIINPRTNEMELAPIHDERALRLAQLICKDIQPDEIWNAGDHVDLSSLSRWKPDSDHFHKTLGPSFQRAHDFYAQLRADNPDARIIEVDSNHNTRLRDFVLKNFPQAHDLYRPGQEEDDYPIMSYPYLANLRAVEVEWISGYGAAQYEYGLDYYEEIDGRTYPKPPIVLRHGTETSNNGTTASKVHKNNPDVLAVQGHDHDPQTYIRRNRLGQIVGAVIVPPLCSVDGEVPSYHSAVDDKNKPVVNRESWTQGVVHIRDYEGDYEIQTIYFRDGKANYNGKEYDGNIDQE